MMIVRLYTRKAIADSIRGRPHIIQGLMMIGAISRNSTITGHSRESEIRLETIAGVAMISQMKEFAGGLKRTGMSRQTEQRFRMAPI